MKFELYSELYNQALRYDDCDMYVAERGWQDWMDNFSDGNDVSVISTILSGIFDVAHMDIKKMRADLGLSFKSFRLPYWKPSRTAQDWEYGKNKTPEYILKFVGYTILLRRLENEQN